MVAHHKTEDMENSAFTGLRCTMMGWKVALDLSDIQPWACLHCMGFADAYCIQTRKQDDLICGKSEKVSLITILYDLY